MPGAVFALVTDLFFASKIGETARTLGVPCQVARDLPTLLARAAAAPPSLIIVDLVLRDADAIAALTALRANAVTAAVPIVTYLPHERDDLDRAARAAGATQVLTKGQLSKQLPRLIADACT